MKILAAVLIFCVLMSSHIASAGPPYGCYDYCTTFCVQYSPDNRRVERCNIKCGIQCGPDSKVDGHLG